MDSSRHLLDGPHRHLWVAKHLCLHSAFQLFSEEADTRLSWRFTMRQRSVSKKTDKTDQLETSFFYVRLALPFREDEEVVVAPCVLRSDVFLGLQYTAGAASHTAKAHNTSKSRGRGRSGLLKAFQSPSRTAIRYTRSVPVFPLSFPQSLNDDDDETERAERRKELPGTTKT